MAKKKQTEAQKKKEKEITINPSLSEFIGKKLSDISKESNETVLHFSNGYSIILSGYVNFKIGETK